MYMQISSNLKIAHRMKSNSQYGNSKSFGVVSFY